MARNRVLIIDDDRNSVRFLQLELEHEGYSVEKEYDGLRGLQRATQEKFDLVLLDIMLPGLDGMEVLQKFRRVSDTPVIMLTARDAVSDKVLGLDGGADDYLTKPFAIEELLARMRAALKKNGTAEGGRRNVLQIGLLTVDRSTREAGYDGQPIQLTKREFDLLCYLMENHDIVCSRDKLMEKVWEYDFSGETNLVDVYIRYLRNKIDYRFHIELIHTIRGVGYIIKTYEI
ncbi:response regulator transcription factor [Caproiciproducens sp. NJN-50]|uniref:response regulator transcription factor n=1 Tax=Acutalibacteraceae TaxID=3082771 RepID=UPI000FFE1E96|nr:MULTISPECIES: response regulator transcription factor [Acutalibacteraceae]QAT50775.1 response regulator transcription factor [Caproiciproducens sp. NJN-50]